MLLSTTLKLQKSITDLTIMQATVEFMTSRVEHRRSTDETEQNHC